jgi:hypothetical protein
MMTDCLFFYYRQTVLIPTGYTIHHLVHSFKSIFYNLARDNPAPFHGPAINKVRGIFIEFVYSINGIGLMHINIYSLCNMSLNKLPGCSNIENNNNIFLLQHGVCFSRINPGNTLSIYNQAGK